MTLRFRVDLIDHGDGWESRIFDLLDHGEDVMYAGVTARTLEQVLRFSAPYLLEAAA